MDEVNSPTTVKSRYEQLATKREQYLERAREASELTLPFLIPPQESNETRTYATPMQGIGARGVNHLSSKLLLALLPQAPFFQLKIDEFKLKELEGDEALKTQIDSGLAEIERAVMTDIEIKADRVGIFEAIKHLIVGGNVLLYVAEEGLRVFPLERYVCKRDPMGSVTELITKESIGLSVLPEDIRKAVLKVDQALDYSSRESSCDIYTHICRKNKKWEVFQEAKGVKIPESVGTYSIDKSPYIALRMSRVDGEDYGRGYVEQYLGDLKSLEGLQKAIIEGSAAASKVLFLCSPNGTTRASTLATAPNGAIREGNANDVSVLQVGKFADFRIAYDSIARIEQRLQFAFLLNTAVQRQAERVTAEEVRYVSEELESSLGGVYSILSQEFQLPYVARKMQIMEKKKRLPTLPKGIVKPSITTGLAAIGRGTDRNKLVNFLRTLADTLGPEIIQKFVNVDDAITRLATSDGLDTKGLIKTKEDLEAEMQQQMQDMQMQQANQVAGDVAGKAAPEMAKQGLTPEVAEAIAQQIPQLQQG